MTSKAHVQFDVARFGVKLAVLREQGRQRIALVWQDVALREVDDATEASGDEWLHLDEDDARAIYEALADYFGHSGHDTRALRKDYDAERARVDKLLGHLTGGMR